MKCKSFRRVRVITQRDSSQHDESLNLFGKYVMKGQVQVSNTGNPYVDETEDDLPHYFQLQKTLGIYKEPPKAVPLQKPRPTYARPRP